MTAAGLIFSNIHDGCIPEMTRVRTMASVPFGCRYRLIDFALSNMVNSDITKVGVITHYNYQSLLDHIGNGKDWDLARRSGGIKILPPYITAYENAAAGRVYNTRLEAILNASNFISRCTEDYIVLSDCDVICNIDLSDVIRQHQETEAEITIVTKRLDLSKTPVHHDIPVVTANEDGVITDYAEETLLSGEVDVSVNIMVMSRTYLSAIIAESVAHGYTGFHRDIIRRYMYKGTFRVYRYDGLYASISSLDAYYSASMMMLDPEKRKALFNVRNRPIYTKVRNSAPTKYADHANVKNSLVADGCVIEGTVENSILFRGVKVGRGSVVRNSILLQDTYIGSDVSLNCVISDKNVIVKDGRHLSGHESMPFFIGKSVMV